MSLPTWDVLRKRCYVPYSGRRDVCVIQGASGTMYPGIRIENISFPLSMDAVQVAVLTCISEGDHPEKLLLPESHGSGFGTRTTHTAVSSSKNTSFNDEKAQTEIWINRYSLKTDTITNETLTHSGSWFQTTEEKIDTEHLIQLTERCVIPYSGFPVTALLKTDIGIFSGTNIEVSDWQQGLCAERTALAKARASGAREYQEIHVYAPQSDYVSPCGACRQVLAEHMPGETITLVHTNEELSQFIIKDLLPYQFKAKNLSKKNRI